METERQLARFVARAPFETLPAAALQMARRVLLATVGTAIGGTARR